MQDLFYANGHQESVEEVMPNSAITKDDWIRQALAMPGCSISTCDKCGNRRHGFGLLLTAQFKCLWCLADERFAKTEIDVDDFARI